MAIELRLVPIIPDRLGPGRKFKQKRRAALRAAQRALKHARVGCVFTPARDEIAQADDLINRAIGLCSQKQWGR